MNYPAFLAEAQRRGFIRKETHRLRNTEPFDLRTCPLVTHCNPRDLFGLFQLLGNYGTKEETTAAQRALLAMVAERDDLRGPFQRVVWVNAENPDSGMQLPRNPVTMRDWLRSHGYEHWVNQVLAGKNIMK